MLGGERERAGDGPAQALGRVHHVADDETRVGLRGIGKLLDAGSEARLLARKAGVERLARDPGVGDQVADGEPAVAVGAGAGDGRVHQRAAGRVQFSG